MEDHFVGITEMIEIERKPLESTSHEPAEINFESEICQDLTNNGWFYAEGDANGCDRGWTVAGRMRRTC